MTFVKQLFLSDFVGEVFLLIEILKVMNRYTIETCVCGYHVYKDIWEARVGEELSCE